jgi:hypothetical protein
MGLVTTYMEEGNTYKCAISLSDKTMSLIESSSKFKTSHPSPSILDVRCSSLNLELHFHSPVNWNTTKLQLSRKNKSLTVIAPRAKYNFYDERVLNFVSCSNKLVFPSVKLSNQTLSICCMGQITGSEQVNLSRYHETPALLSDIENVKTKISKISQALNHNIKVFNIVIAVSKGSKSTRHVGCIAVHDNLFDVSKQLPAYDISYYISEDSNQLTPYPIIMKWAEFCCHKLGQDLVVQTPSELLLLRKIFNYFASRTIIHNNNTSLGEYDLDDTFQRAIINHLYAKEDRAFKINIR